MSSDVISTSFQAYCGCDRAKYRGCCHCNSSSAHTRIRMCYVLFKILCAPERLSYDPFRKMCWSAGAWTAAISASWKADSACFRLLSASLKTMNATIKVKIVRGKVTCSHRNRAVGENVSRFSGKRITSVLNNVSNTVSDHLMGLS